MLLVATLNFAHTQHCIKLDFRGVPITQIYFKFWKFILEMKLIAWAYKTSVSNFTVCAHLPLRSGLAALL